MSESFLNNRLVLHPGDCLAVLPTLADNSFDACVTDPPYALVSIIKRFGEMGPNDKKLTMGRIDPYQRVAGGFMNQKWDVGDVAHSAALWREVYRVLKPGAYVLAFGGTRTYHRLACAIEDAGFEIRDMVSWLYGSGFPKSHDVSKAIDRAAGVEREVVGEREVWGNNAKGGRGGQYANGQVADADGSKKPISITAPATPAAAQWSGWGTALKPACEPICMARKPLSEKTVAANVLKWGTGAINVDGCRVGTENTQRHTNYSMRGGNYENHKPSERIECGSDQGRWPANVVHDGSDEVVAGFPTVGDSHPPDNEGSVRANRIFGSDNRPREFHPGFADTGSAARFFYTAKADSDDRLGSKHPTVKPVDLMQWLVRLVTPPGGNILDPFAGTGTTGEAAYRENFSAVLIEREAAYCDDIRRRVKLILAGPEERARESLKASGKAKGHDDLPLFASREETGR